MMRLTVSVESVVNIRRPTGHCDRSWLTTLRLIGKKIIHGPNHTTPSQLEQDAADSCAFPVSER
jgi:hypothetical protein